MNTNKDDKEKAIPLPSPIYLTTVSKPRTRPHPSCEICGLIFYKEHELKMHLDEAQWMSYQQEVYNDFFKCNECCMFFKSERGYKQHVVKIHSEKHMHLKCKICKKKFKNKSAVKFHKKQEHMKEIRGECPICGKEFYNKYLLPKHIEKCKNELMNKT